MSKNLYSFLGILIGILCINGCVQNNPKFDLVSPQASTKITTFAYEYLEKGPITITAQIAERSKGGKHDYYSEGPYWWPNPNDLKGPYIRKDGDRNPDNFIFHRRALGNFSKTITTLTAAYIIKNDQKYIDKIQEHLAAWFVNKETKMNPHFLYAQAIKGINSGRGIGLIDAVSLIDVANSLSYLSSRNLLPEPLIIDVKIWFNSLIDWMTIHQYGIDEKNNNNNHSTWWGAQVAAYAKFTNRKDILDSCKTHFNNQILIQIAEDGSFPDELFRTKPFHYVNYNLQAWTEFALLTFSDDNQAMKNQPSLSQLQKSIEFMIPYLTEIKNWPYFTDLEPQLDIYSFDYLLFAYWIFGDVEYKELWLTLPKKEEQLSSNIIVWEKIIHHE